ncbi:hypothetical protein ACFY5J_02465 [Peribacillus butanolivorans]|uniref:hypothetical protein n=1 Tax=Peribacillus butanolivorans TaxID=421767 RepID=UPI00369C9414
MENSIIRKKQVNEEEVPASDQYLKEIRDLLQKKIHGRMKDYKFIPNIHQTGNKAQ